MRTCLTIILVACGLSLAATAQAQNAADLYQQALRKERTEGNLRDAITLYEQVVRSSDRALGARALLRIGAAYEKLGRTDAVNAYQRLVRDFADQSEPVSVARQRLNALAVATVAPASPMGLTARRVWHDPGVGTEGQPTPDGRYLTFVDWETGDLAVREVATGQQRLLTKTGYPAYALGSSISRDGRTVAYMWTTGEGEREWLAQLRLIGIDGTGERVLVANANQEITYFTPYEWTPDGAYVLVILQRNAGSELALVDTRTGAIRSIKSFASGWPTRATLSPDGKWIAYDIGPSLIERDIFVLAADGSAEYPLAPGPANDLHPIWSSDGADLFFSSDRSGSVGLWRIRVASGRASSEPELVKADMTPGFHPMGFTAAGALFYSHDNGGGDIYTVAFDPAGLRIAGEPRRFVQRYQGLNLSSHFSPKGDLLAYMSRRNNISMGHAVRLIVQNLSSGAEQMLRAGSQRPHARPRFSPDGSQILLWTRWSLTEERITVTDVAAGTTSILTTASAAQFGSLADPVWSRDGRDIYYFRNDTVATTRAQPRLVRRNIASGDEQVVHYLDVMDVKRLWELSRLWALSPDERSIAYADRDTVTKQWTIRVAPLGGNGSEILRVAAPQLISANAGLNWTPDGKHILYVLRPDERWVGDPSFSLYAVPAAGGEPRSTGLTAHELRHVNFMPDGRTLTFTAGPPSYNEVWVLEHLPRAQPAQR